MPTNRRNFLKNSSLLSAGLGLAGTSALKAGSRISRAEHIPHSGNQLPLWKGFNVQDFFSANPKHRWKVTTDEELQWMADWGFNFVRIPMAYPYFLDINHRKKISPEQVYQLSEQRLQEVDELVYRVNKFGMHASVNMHRAPGYCINAGFHEPFNLWKDKEAREAFYWYWEMWAKRYQGLSREQVSFDLLNEPAWIEDMNDQHSSKTVVPGDSYGKLVEEAASRIWAINPDHLVIADGNNVGSDVIPEITHLPIGQSCRGYYPHVISHYKAHWVYKEEQITQLPELKYPGQVGDQWLSREMLERYYAPWIELVRSGVGVHCGEAGCYNLTPHGVFMDWFGDIIDILYSNGIGVALWSFSGNFGVLDSGRMDVDYEDWYGRKLDRKLLDLMRKGR